VLDFTDPSDAHVVAFADPAPLSEEQLIFGGDWSTYWYNGFIYESDIRRGLIIWKLADPAVAGAMRLHHLNPQTQETSFPPHAGPVGQAGVVGDESPLVQLELGGEGAGPVPHPWAVQGGVGLPGGEDLQGRHGHPRHGEPVLGAGRRLEQPEPPYREAVEQRCRPQVDTPPRARTRCVDDARGPWSGNGNSDRRARSNSA
jgi:hypothetical protein